MEFNWILVCIGQTASDKRRQETTKARKSGMDVLGLICFAYIVPHQTLARLCLAVRLHDASHGGHRMRAWTSVAFLPSNALTAN